jgi:DNA-binding NarL/FixJ family response regulator
MNVLLVDDHPIIHETPDLALPGYAGMEAFYRFRTEQPRARIAVISASEEQDKVQAALQAGAAGYLPKTLLPKAMADAIRVMLDGGVYSPLGRA